MIVIQFFFSHYPCLAHLVRPLGPQLGSIVVVEETTSLTKEAELEDKYITLDKPEPFEEDNKKEPTRNTSFFSIKDVPVSVSLHSLQFSCSIDDCNYKFSTQTIIFV